VDGFVIERALGSGLSGTSFMAWTQGAGGRAGSRRVAVKLCHPTRCRLLPWSQALTQERDERLVRYDAVGPDGGDGWKGYYATDLLTLLSYPDALGRLTLAERLEVVAEAAEALAVLHAQNLAHGTIKPSNVLLRRNHKGQVRPLITDLGLQPVYDPAFHDQPEVAVRLYPYLAPEAVEGFREGDPGRAFGPSQDCYGLGALMCALGTGAGPGAELFTNTRSQAPAAAIEDLLAAKRRGGGWFIHALPEPQAESTSYDRPGPDLRRVNQLLAAALSPDPRHRPRASQLASTLRESISSPSTSQPCSP
jgi:serine/threonine protein kinase